MKKDIKERFTVIQNPRRRLFFYFGFLLYVFFCVYRTSLLNWFVSCVSFGIQLPDNQNKYFSSLNGIKGVNNLVYRKKYMIELKYNLYQIYNYCGITIYLLIALRETLQCTIYGCSTWNVYISYNFIYCFSGLCSSMI